MMAYDIDAAKMARVLNTSQEKLSDKAVRSAVKRVDPMKSQTGLTREQIIDDLLAWFTPHAPLQLNFAVMPRSEGRGGSVR